MVYGKNKAQSYSYTKSTVFWKALSEKNFGGHGE